MTHDELAQVLLSAVRAQHFEGTPDAMRGGAPLAQFPSLDLAVVAFPRNAPPVFANVLFSREFPQGVVAKIGADAGSVRKIRFEADLRDEALNSIAWSSAKLPYTRVPDSRRWRRRRRLDQAPAPSR